VERLLAGKREGGVAEGFLFHFLHSLFAKKDSHGEKPNRLGGKVGERWAKEESRERWKWWRGISS